MGFEARGGGAGCLPAWVAALTCRPGLSLCAERHPFLQALDPALWRAAAADPAAVDAFFASEPQPTPPPNPPPPQACDGGSPTPGPFLSSVAKGEKEEGWSERGGEMQTEKQRDRETERQRDR